MAFIGGLDCGERQLTWSGYHPSSGQFSDVAVQESRRDAESPWNVLLPGQRLIDRSLIAEHDQLVNHRVLFNLTKACKQHLQHRASPYLLLGVAMPYAARPLLRAVVRSTMASAMDLRSSAPRGSDWVRVWETPLAAAAGWWSTQAPLPTSNTLLITVTCGENCLEWTRLTIGPRHLEVHQFAESAWNQVPASFTDESVSGSTRWLIDERLPYEAQVCADECRGPQPRETALPLSVLIAQGAAWLTAQSANESSGFSVHRLLPRAVGLLVQNVEGKTYWMTLARQGDRLPERGSDYQLRCTPLGERSPEIHIACWSDGAPPGDWVREERWRPHARWWQPAVALKYSPALTAAQLAMSARETFNGWQWEATTGKVAGSD